MITVLLVEDEAITRNGLMRHIPWASLGVNQVHSAEDAETALEMCRHIRPEIIVSDIRMRGIDGIEMCRQLKKMLPHCQIIFISSYDQKEYLKAAIELDAIQYVEKPIAHDQLIGAVKKAIERYMQVCEHELLQANYEASIRKALQKGALVEIEDAIDHVFYTLFEEKNAPIAVVKNTCRIILGIFKEYSNNTMLDKANSVDGLAGELALEQATDVAQVKNILLAYAKHLNQPVVDSTKNVAVRQVINYMYRHYGQKNLDIQTLSKEVFLSAAYLSNLFKQETGTTVNHFLTKIRIERAKILLLDIQLKQYQVAGMVGYEDPAYFARVFKQHTGITPSEYREQHCV